MTTPREQILEELAGEDARLRDLEDRRTRTQARLAALRAQIVEMQLGPVRFAVDPKGHAASRPFEHRLIVRETDFRMGGVESRSTIQEICRGLTEDSARKQLIVDDVIRSLEEGRSPILLTERKDQLEFLAVQLRGFVQHLVVLQGEMSERERRDRASELSRIPDEQERLALATGRSRGEGFDDARLDTLFLAMPFSWKATLVRHSGGLHRLHPRNAEVRIYDYVDRDVLRLRRMFERRLRTCRAIGYARNQAPPDDESFDRPTIEYDPEATRYFEEVNRQ